VAGGVEFGLLGQSSLAALSSCELDERVNYFIVHTHGGEIHASTYSMLRKQKKRPSSRRERTELSNLALFRQALVAGKDIGDQNGKV